MEVVVGEGVGSEYDNRKLRVVELTDAGWSPTGKHVIAVAATDAGPGQHVLINYEGNGARQVLKDDKAPVRTVIVGVVDELAITSS